MVNWVKPERIARQAYVAIGRRPGISGHAPCRWPLPWSGAFGYSQTPAARLGIDRTAQV